MDDCPWCGRSAVAAGRHYCSETCRQAAKWRRKATRINARRRAMRSMAPVPIRYLDCACGRVEVRRSPRGTRCRRCEVEANREVARLAAAQKYQPRRIERACRSCGTVFLAMVTSGDQCSPCRKNAERRARKIARKRQLRSAAVERFTLLEIAVRDGWRCHLCHRKVTKKTWSEDHLIPLSAGGLHTRQNVALAHQLCNSKRRETGPAQLRLVG